MTNFIITKKDKKSYKGKILSLPSATKHNKQYAVKFFERFTCEKYKKSLFGYGDITLFLARNYEWQILQKENKFRSNGRKFLVPIPQPELI